MRERRALLRRRVRVGQGLLRRLVRLLRIREVAADVFPVPCGDPRVFQQLVRKAERERRRGARADAPPVRRAVVLRDRAPQLAAPGLAERAKERIVPPVSMRAGRMIIAPRFQKPPAGKDSPRPAPS